MSDRQNFVLGVTNGALFTLADTLVDPTLVQVALLTSLSASPFLIGLLFPLRNLVWYLPQLWVSGFMQVRPMKLPLYRRTSLVRGVLWIGLTLAVFTLHDPGWLLLAIFLVLPMIDLLGGLSAVSFMDVVAKVVPPRERGDFFAWRLTVGGVLAIGAGLVVRLVLDENGPLVFPQNFGLLFALTAGAAITGMTLFSLVREPAEPSPIPRASLRAQLRQARTVLAANPNYQRFLRMRAALMLAGAATPFFVVFAQTRLGLPASNIGLYLAAYTASGLAASFLYVRISRKAGHQRSAVVMSVAGLAMIGLALAAALLARPLALPAGLLTVLFVLVFILSGLRETGIGVAANSLLLDLAPPGQGPLYVGITHSVLGLVLVLAAGSGLVVEGFGHVALFLVAGVAQLAAVWDALHMGGTESEGVVTPPPTARCRAAGAPRPACRPRHR